ncbi:winged helix-turn-helix transcriptional regulator [Candidatus Methanarcanum hacksteinii]|uniref:winged helix-turn-helix transcriptional regulator n=1 Tax=Candidatus Methanarcanum hacksteinii TaxID=2911857 RepID=UPI0037DC45F7
MELPATRSIHEGLDFEIVNKMESNPKITRTELASDLGVAESTISNHISSLIADGYIAREGSKKTGVWVILRK